MKRRLNSLLAVLLAVAGLGAITAIVLSLVLPEKIRVYAVQAIAEKTGKDVSIGSASLNVFSGIVLKNVRISEANGLPWVIVERVKASFTVFSLLSPAPITSLELDCPRVFLKLRQDGTLDFTLAAARGKKDFPPIAIRSLKIHDGSLTLTDPRFSPSVRKSLTKIEGLAWLEKPATVFYRASASVETGAGRVSINGRFQAAETLTVADVDLDAVKFSDLKPYAKQLGISESLLQGRVHVEHSGGYLRVKPDIRFKRMEFAAGGLRGQAQILLNANIYSTAAGLADYSGTVTFEHCKIDLGGESLEINGPIDFTHNGIVWKALKVGYAGHSYLSSGSLRDYARPSLTMGIYSKEATLEAQAAIKEKVLQVQRIKADLRDSMVFLQGTADLSKLPAVPVRFSADCDAELSDFNLILGKNRGWTDAAPAGRVNGQMNISGDIRDFSNLELSAKAKSSGISLYGWTAGNVNLEYRQTQGKAGAVYNFSFYEGTVNGSLDFALSNGLPYTLQVDAEGVRIEKFKEDTAMKDRDLAGKLSCNALFSGKLTEPDNSTGHGQVELTDGMIWQLDILSALHQHLLSGLGRVTFEKGYADFQVKSRDLLLHDVNLLSTLIQLAGKGTLHSDGRVDAVVDVRISDKVLPNLGKLRELGSLILRQTGRIVGVRVSGTRKEPKFTLQQPLLSQVFKKIDKLLKRK